MTSTHEPEALRRADLDPDPVAQLRRWLEDAGGARISRTRSPRPWPQAARFGEGDIPRPPFWGGYRLVPDAFEFWKSRRDRLHDRFRHTQEPGGTWCVARLSP